MRNVMLCILVIVLAILWVFNTGAQQGQSREDRLNETIKLAQQKQDEELPLVDYNAPKPAEASARARREAKDKRHDLGRAPIAEGMTSTARIYHWPADFPPIPVVQSKAIVIGKVSGAQAHLSDDKSGVYSEITVKADQVLKDNVGINTGRPITAEREGGRVRFPSGSIYRYFVTGFGIPRVGGCYLLFLDQLEDGDFRILTGYEIRDGRVVPLDESGVVHFEKYKGADEATFLTEVRESIIKQN